jgi:hypothetical protein
LSCTFLVHPIISPTVTFKWTRLIGVVAVCVLVFVVALAVTPPRGPRSMRRFDPDRLAALEVGMWQAYYAKHRVRLFGLLVTTLREQYRYSWAVAAREAFHLARAAATFGDLRGGYDVVLPDLERAYGTAKSWMRAGFDPAAVARAELAWWVARRVGGENSPEHVGALIADEYALLYETSARVVADAARLRADAAALRDQQAPSPDWDAVGELLRRSYRELLAALSVVNV